MIATAHAPGQKTFKTFNGEIPSIHTMSLPWKKQGLEW